MKVAILGARGQLGQELTRIVPGEVIPLGRPEVDLARPDTIAVALAGLSADVTPVSSAEYGLKARRPRYSVLDCAKYHALGVAPMRRWEDALKDYVLARG